MTQQYRDLLLKDLCARLPYGVKVKVRSNDIRTVRVVDMIEGIVQFVELDFASPFGVHIEHPLTFRQVIKPYLRPMSSMTEEEINIYHSFCKCDDGDFTGETLWFDTIESFDYLNSIHIDYRGLIPKGLAIAVTEENNPYKN